MIAEHHFGSVQAYGLDANLHLVGRRCGHIQLFQPKDTGVTVFMDSDNACHRAYLFVSGAGYEEASQEWDQELFRSAFGQAGVRWGYRRKFRRWLQEAN
ncbi:hypothetical protein D3C78_1599590 [compost metagenome]